MASNEENSRTNIPESSTSKPMDSKKDVAQSPDGKTDEDFPGYPHYPAKEDIMDQRTGSHRVDADLENGEAGPNQTGVSQRYPESDNDDDTVNDETGVPQNVSNEDLGKSHPGTDVEEAAEKGSLNP